MDKQLKILIVEDDIIDREQLKKLLSKSTLKISEVKSAENLDAALELIDEEDFDIVLLDLNLPDSDRMETLLTFNKKCPNVAIVVCTGESGDELGLETVGKGAQDYLVKGEFNPYSLSKTIQYAIERKKIEKSTRQAYKELESANHELKNMHTQLVQSEKLASIGQLAAGVAHEMNTPVGFVASNFETLCKYVEKFQKLIAMYEELTNKTDIMKKHGLFEEIERIKQFREEMKIDFILEDIQGLFRDSKEGIERVTSIIQNLRDFSRIDQAGEQAEYNLNEGITATLTVAKNEIKYDCNLKTDFGEIPLIFCNPGQINQVFLNILVNASQAIKSQNKEDLGNIEIKTYSDNNYVVCEINDDGPGIPEDKLKRIFDPFFTTKPPGKGTGLGLSVSYDIIVNKHKGQIQVESTIGKGSKFIIKLPINVKKAEDKLKQNLVEIM